MYTESLVKLGKVRSEIREIFEYGNKRKAEIGAENVFDFSIGNPSVPAPKSVNDAIIDLVNNSRLYISSGRCKGQNYNCKLH